MFCVNIFNKLAGKVLKKFKKRVKEEDWKKINSSNFLRIADSLSVV